MWTISPIARHGGAAILVALGPLAIGGCAPAAPPSTALAVVAARKPVGLASAAHSAEPAARALRDPAPRIGLPEPAPAPEQPEPSLLVLDDPPRCPPEMALVLERVCVDRWEASLVRMLPGGIETPWSPFETPSGNDVRAVSLPGVTPQGYISGEQAERACANSGKRLCTANEWEAACRGPARTTYPYGNERRRRACNDAGRRMHPVAEVTKRLGLPEDRMWYEGMEHPLINQLDDTLHKTGGHADCTNEFGVFDMVGNLHEWIDDPDGTFRGGYYLDTIQNGEGCDYATTAHSKKYHDYSTGFRCCMDPDSVE